MNDKTRKNLNILLAAMRPPKIIGEKNIGGLDYKTAKAYGNKVAQVIATHGGTLIWDMDCPVNGRGYFDNIFQYLAAEMMASGGTPRARMQASQEFEQAARAGVTTLDKFFNDAGGVLYRATKPGSDNLLAVITTDSDYVVDVSTGETASERTFVRDTTHAEGQVRAAFKRLARAKGETIARIDLLASAQRTVSKPLPSPHKLIEEEG